MRSMTLLTTTLVLTMAFAGCTTSEGTGSASLYIKDQATDDFQEVHVLITDARVHEAGDDDQNGTDGNDTADDDTASSDADGWHTVYENPDGLDIDLLAMQGELAAFIGEINLTAGKYTQIRFTLDSAYGIDNDGERVEITVTNGQVFINKPFTIDADVETRIIIDVDLDKSLVRQGGNAPVVDEPTYRLNPVIGSTTTEQVEDSESGADVHSEGEAAAVA